MALKTQKAASRAIRLAGLVLIAIVLCLAFLLLRATANDNAERAGTSSVDHTDISYSWWGNDARHRYTMAGLSDFTKANPDIVVTPTFGVWDGYEQRYASMMRAHDECDVMQINYAWLATYSPDGTGYYDLNDLSDTIDLSQFNERDRAFGTRNGHLNALPIAYNMPVFFYNESLLDRYGLSVPRTWDDLFACARTLRADGVSTLSMTDKQLWMMMLAWYEQTQGTPVFDASDACLIDESGFETILSLCDRMIAEGVIDLDAGSPAQQFANGKTAGVLIWESDASRYCQPLADAGQTVALGQHLGETDTSETGWYMKPATMLAISKATAHPQEAARLVNYLLNDPDYALAQGTEKGVPVSSSACRSLVDNGKVSGFEQDADRQMRDHQDELAAMVPAMEDTQIVSTFKDCVRKCHYGKAAIPESARELRAAVSARS